VPLEEQREAGRDISDRKEQTTVQPKPDYEKCPRWEY